MKRWTNVAVIAVVVAGCGTADTKRPPQKPPQPVIVPLVKGELALDAVDRLEAVGLRPRYASEPDQPELCRVSWQNPEGSARRGEEVTLGLRCKVRIRNVVGRTVDAAQRGLRDFDIAYVPYEPSNPSGCTVTGQDKTGNANPGSSVTLTVSCAITVGEIGQSARSLARKSTERDGGDYEVTNCRVTGINTGVCDVRYFNTPDDIECDGEILVTQDQDEGTINAHGANTDCY